MANDKTTLSVSKAVADRVRRLHKQSKLDMQQGDFVEMLCDLWECAGNTAKRRAQRVLFDRVLKSQLIK